jgi:glutathione synthase/RimK-type ligase-like ATP-grasp enzyme
MKIAIHQQKGSFSDRWIRYCEECKIQYKLVNCYNSDIISQLADCEVLMWHHTQTNYRDVLFAKQLLFSLQQSGKKVFPDFNTCWHFDDKLGQKYLFESIGAPCVKSYVFYNKEDALSWIKTASFPKVFKLRCGSGSANVKLINSKLQAKCLIRKAFGRGFPMFDRFEDLKERVRKFSEGKGNILRVFKGIARLVLPSEFVIMSQSEKGYIYFQDYIANNSYDIRVIVIGDRAFALKRIVRKNDFRASGSGNILFEKENINLTTVRLSFELTDKIQAQCAAYDFIYDINGKELVVELSYGFEMLPYDSCVGYWDKSLKFHEEKIHPQDWMIESILDNER